jgi:hypothetical protein
MAVHERLMKGDEAYRFPNKPIDNVSILFFEEPTSWRSHRSNLSEKTDPHSSK